ncbi:MAG: zf-HC2 domain-containing protein [Bryobacteraceae bacterium]
MSSLGMRHPEEGQLLRYLDGELPGRRARQIRKHLEACWHCRAELEELESTAGDCVRYRKNVLGTCLPPPPDPWQDLSLGFDRIDASLGGESLAARLARVISLPRPAVPWAVTGAIAVAVVSTIVYQWRETPSVQAAALLKKAVAVADSRPRPARRIRIRTASVQLTRVVGAGQPASDAPAIERLFRSANYNWDDPLSARSFETWRDQLPAKRDEVAAIEDPQSPDRNSYRIQTTTDASELVSASLKLRMTDFEPLEGRFEFRSRDWVEMTELTDQPTLPASTVAGATGGMPRQPGMPPDRVEASAEPMNPAGVAEELQVVAALHQVGADLGDPVEIARESGQILVSGTGIPPQHQKQIHEALDSMPGVVVRFSEPGGVPSGPGAPPETPALRDSAGSAPPPFQARLEERLGGRPQYERFSSQLLDGSDAVMSRAYALRRLAQQFPPDVERQLSAEGRRQLRDLGREHVAALARQSGEMDAALSRILAALGGAPPGEVRLESAAWQPASEELLSAARRVETVLAVLLGMAPPDNPADHIPSQLLAALAQLRASQEHCQRLLSYDGR